MLDFLRKKTRSTGSVLFRGAIPPRLENFYFLKDVGVELTPESAGEESVWAARARHPQWGEAMLICPRQFQAPSRPLLEFDPRLTKAEVESILACGSGVTMGMIHEQQNVLRERKLALRMLHAIMGQDGLAIADRASQRFWSPAAAAEEVAHDADLDIESLYSLHAVSANKEKNAPTQWLHSHGLAELGYFDFDILQPSPDVFPSGILRALAYGIVEDRIEANSNDIELAQPQGPIRMVPADTFRRRAAARFANLRDGPDGDHSANRSVVCDPIKWP